MADKKINRAKTEENGGSAESQLVTLASWDDLDQEKINNYLGLLDESSDDRSQATANPQERLSALGLVRPVGQDVQPTIAALLLFGRQPQKFLPQSSVKLAHFRGTDVDGLISDRKEVFGTLDKIIEDTARFVTNNMKVQARIERLYREDRGEYPLVAVREAITNALAHRDYSLGGQKVTLRMFDNRLEVESPGGLAGPVTLENLGFKRYSRNPLLTRIMYELRLVEEMGTGIRRMRRAMGDNGNPAPSFVADETAFVATLPALILLDPAPQIQEDHQRPVVAAPPVVAEPEPPVFEISDGHRPEYFNLLQSGLNERQARGLLYARERGRLTNRDYRAVNPDITDETARLDLLSLVDKGYLMRIGDKKGASYLPR